MISLKSLCKIVSLTSIVACLLQLSLPFLATLPNQIQEFLVYAVTLLLLAYSCIFNNQDAISKLVAVIGSVLLAVCMVMTAEFHFSYSYHRDRTASWISGSCAFAWGCLALWHINHYIGFLSISALYYCIFNVAEELGYELHQVFKLVSAFMVAFYMITRLYYCNRIKVFHGGALVLGPIAYFTCILIESSLFYCELRYRHEQHSLWETFFLSNAECVFALLVCIYFGTVHWEMRPMYSFGILFSLFYFIIKYIEFPWEQNTWVIGALLASLLLYAGSYHIESFLKQLEYINV